MQRPDRIRRTAGLIVGLIIDLSRIVADYAEPDDPIWRSTGTATVQNENDAFCQMIDGAGFIADTVWIDVVFDKTTAIDKCICVGLGNPFDPWFSNLIILIGNDDIRFDEDKYPSGRTIGFAGALYCGTVRIGLTIDLTARTIASSLAVPSGRGWTIAAKSGRPASFDRLDMYVRGRLPVGSTMLLGLR